METETSKNAPLLAVVALIIGVSFATGYFHFAGLNWIALCSLQQLFSLTWISLPAAVLFFGGGAIVGKFDGLRFQHNPIPIWPINVARPATTRLANIGWVIVGIFTLCMALFTQYREPKFASSGPIFAIIFIASSKMNINFLIKTQDEYDFFKYPFFAFCIALSSFTYGLSLGAEPFINQSKDVLILKDGRALCVNTIMSGDKFVIYKEGQVNQTNVVRWEDVESLSRNADCSKVRKLHLHR